MEKTYRRNVKKIPLTIDIEYIEPDFQPMETLFLDLMENLNKLKKNPPKPIFVYPKSEVIKQNKQASLKKNALTEENDTIDDFELLDELEKKYKSGNNQQNTETLSDTDIDVDIDIDSHETENNEREPDKTEKKSNNTSESKNSPKVDEYNEQEFKTEQDAEENEEEKMQKRIQDLLFSFMVLRRKNPNIEIPEFTEHSDVELMQRTYNNIIRSISLESSLSWYKKILMVSWLIIEYVSVEIFHIDMSGFANHQIGGLNEYDTLLLELGEKHSSLLTMFPVEVRLIFMVLFNAVIFFLGKMVFSGGGSGSAPKMNILNNIMSMMMGGGGSASPTTNNLFSANTSNQNAPKKRGNMRGPTITPSDVEHFAKQTLNTNDN